MRISTLFERKEILPYLESRGLLKQYKKVKTYLLQGNFSQVRFKERHPKGSGIWYFRINKQYRALCVFNDNGDLVVFEIDNHQ